MLRWLFRVLFGSAQRSELPPKIDAAKLALALRRRRMLAMPPIVKTEGSIE